MSRTFSTSSTHREVIQAQGHSGSNQKSTGVLPEVCSDMVLLERQRGRAYRHTVVRAGVAQMLYRATTRQHQRPPSPFPPRTPMRGRAAPAPPPESVRREGRMGGSGLSAY
ncbi:hypothetical protein SGFS_076370 [Streptomyces graminofaciens]|uniref:Uncharacterized protein n=1 Tax=Streptomyces graminofaciens TaxID=68212 RepID=A0ABN5VUY8_9ACTN|nr:hypothetical protein SGFS_076370 [Streptomyces graminofaciens]